MAEPTSGQMTRRSTLLGAAGLGIGVPVLAACGADGTEATDPAGDPTSAAATTPSSADQSSGTASSDGAAPTGDPIASTDDIEVGGGKIFADDNVVITQPESGTFKAFSATCTHQQCLVTKIEDKQIVCTCHFSKYSIEDGSVESGPAPKPLPEETISVTGGQIYLS